MHELMTLDAPKLPAAPQYALIPCGETVSVDAEDFAYDKEMSFRVSANGKSIGLLNYYPERSCRIGKIAPHWQACLHEEGCSAGESRVGYGQTPDVGDQRCAFGRD